MGELKDRDTTPKPKIKSVVRAVRLREEVDSSLETIAAERKISRNAAVSYLIQSYKRKGGRHAEQSCEECDREFSVGERYYCELANEERFVEGKKPGECEIEVLDSNPTKILCERCARKEGKLKQFDEPSEGGDFVGESERNV